MTHIHTDKCSQDRVLTSTPTWSLTHLFICTHVPTGPEAWAPRTCTHTWGICSSPYTYPYSQTLTPLPTQVLALANTFVQICVPQMCTHTCNYTHRNYTHSPPASGSVHYYTNQVRPLTPSPRYSEKHPLPSSAKAFICCVQAPLSPRPCSRHLRLSSPLLRPPLFPNATGTRLLGPPGFC